MQWALMTFQWVCCLYLCVRFAIVWKEKGRQLSFFQELTITMYKFPTTSRRWSLQGWESSGFCLNSGFFMVPRVILEICLDFGRNILCVYEHDNCEFLKLWSCTPFYPDSVCPELAWRRTILKWPSVTYIHAFRGGLQARLWQTKTGLRSFVKRFLQATHRVARDNSFALWEVCHMVLGLWVCTKRVQRK